MVGYGLLFCVILLGVVFVVVSIVVGGVLVHKDVGHLTRDFSATLGPYLLRSLSTP